MKKLSLGADQWLHHLYSRSGFWVLLAVTSAEGPSVIQIRVQDVLPAYLGKLVIAALQEYQVLLETGALIMVDESKLRARILPFR